MTPLFSLDNKSVFFIVIGTFSHTWELGQKDLFIYLIFLSEYPYFRETFKGEPCHINSQILNLITF
jgi:hypothetical protein